MKNNNGGKSTFFTEKVVKQRNPLFYKSADGLRDISKNIRRIILDIKQGNMSEEDWRTLTIPQVFEAVRNEVNNQCALYYVYSTSLRHFYNSVIMQSPPGTVLYESVFIDELNKATSKSFYWERIRSYVNMAGGDINNIKAMLLNIQSLEIRPNNL